VSHKCHAPGALVSINVVLLCVWNLNLLPLLPQVKGQSIYAFVTLVDGVPDSEELRKDLVLTVRKQVYTYFTVAFHYTKKVGGKKLRKPMNELGLKLIQIHSLLCVIFFLLTFFPSNQTDPKIMSRFITRWQNLKERQNGKK
jgi:hypothetical protein